jgi:hypothetical protein
LTLWRRPFAILAQKILRQPGRSQTRRLSTIQHVHLIAPRRLASFPLEVRRYLQFLLLGLLSLHARWIR